jgi:polysaccharide chain length determinant protein (PEP-CTERM system associated)
LIRSTEMKNFQGLGPADFARIFWRRKWYSAATFLLVAAGVAIYVWRLPNLYRSEARVLVQSAMIPQDYVRPSDNTTPEARIAAIREQVLSRTFIESMIQELQMFGYPANRFSMDDAVKSVGGNLAVISTSRDTFSISFTSTDPQSAQNFNRRVLDKLSQNTNSAKQTMAVEADQFLDDQLRDTEAKLRTQDEKIKQFKISHLGELPEQSAANMNALSGLQAQLAAVENTLQHARDQRKLLDFRAQEQKRLGLLSRSLVSSAPNQVTSDTTPGAPSPLSSLLAAKQMELAALKTKYMPAHPDVERLSREVEELKNQIAATTSKTPDLTLLGEGKKEQPAWIDAQGSQVDTMLDVEAAELRLEAESLNNEVSKREKEREAILGQIKAYYGKLNLAPAIEQELGALSLEYETLKGQYTNLHNKKFQTAMTYNLESDRKNDIYKVIDEPNLPENPVFPNRIQISLMGFGAALLLGIGAAFGREMLDSTLGSEHEVVSALSIPVLASISEIPRKDPRRLKGLSIRRLGKTA